MISLRTNMSSLITQQNMGVSTNRLNTAIERMSTGYKINHAADNAANYSISKNMNTQLSACDVAADNIAMGMDLLTVAQDTIAGMQDRGSRIHALITQARNGTYGATSLSAMTQEAQAIASEISRLYNNTEYNGIKLFEGISLPDWAQEVKATAGTINGMSLEDCARANNGFIAEVVCDTPEVTITNPLELEDAINDNTIIGIGNAETLAELAKIVNGTDGYTANNCSGKTIVLTSDVDISSICAANTDGEGNGGWTPIGNETNLFQGTFNGNGHKVTGLYINRPEEYGLGLFGYTVNADLKNIGLTNIFVTGCGDCVGGLVGFLGATDTITSNCYATGNVNGVEDGCESTGGLVGYSEGYVINCYAEVTVTADVFVGGLVGEGGCIINSYATGNVTGNGWGETGGLAGSAGTITNSYATGSVTRGGDCTGGLAGSAGAITNSYATGSVTGSGDCTGGLAGYAYEAITNSYATGDVSGTSWVGGFVGRYGITLGTVNIDQILAGGTVSGENKVGSLIGGIANTTNGTSFSTINITNASARAGQDMIGYEGTYNGTAYESGQMEGWVSNISEISGMSSTTTLQVGIYSGSDSQISVDTGLSFSLSISDLTSDSAYTSITNFLNQLSQKSVEIGAAQNRLESALESNLVKMDNLTSSLSTIRDADISEVSSDYIRQQILQQAAATLMSTANQSPSIALQLL